METKIIDNFLKQEDLIELQKIDLTEPDNDKIKVYHNKITKDHNVATNALTKIN